MNIDEFIFSQLQDLQRFEEWWRTLPDSDAELPIGDWQDQFSLWLETTDQ